MKAIAQWWTASLLYVACIAVSVSVIVGYAIDEPAVRSWLPNATEMALPTAVICLMLSTGGLMSHTLRVSAEAIANP